MGIKRGAGTVVKRVTGLVRRQTRTKAKEAHDKGGEEEGGKGRKNEDEDEGVRKWLDQCKNASSAPSSVPNGRWPVSVLVRNW